MRPSGMIDLGVVSKRLVCLAETLSRHWSVDGDWPLGVQTHLRLRYHDRLKAYY